MKIRKSIKLLNTFAFWNWWGLKEKKKGKTNNKLSQKIDSKLQFNIFN